MRVFLVIVLLIAYGSLFLGNFFTPSTGGLEEFLSNRYLFTSKSDMLGNIALFFPLRMASMIFVSGKLRTTIPIVWLFLLVLFLHYFFRYPGLVTFPIGSAGGCFLEYDRHGARHDVRTLDKKVSFKMGALY